MEIQIGLHTLERAIERGTDEQEIRDVLETGFDIPAKYGRKGKAKIYEFARERLGRFFPQKRVEVYYTVEGGLIVTITVYVFYGQWRQAS